MIIVHSLSTKNKGRIHIRCADETVHNELSETVESLWSTLSVKGAIKCNCKCDGIAPDFFYMLDVAFEPPRTRIKVYPTT